MKTKFLAKVNEVLIQTVEENGEKLIPVKPICEALGVDWKSQYEKLKDDDFLSSIMVLSTTVAGDEKEREMVCLPLEFVFGRLFTVNPKNVKEEARSNVERYRIECYRVLYKHFFGDVAKRIESDKAEIKLLEEINELNEKRNVLTSELKDKKIKLEKIREARLKTEPELF